ncbi:hypothetical protein GQ607_009082 [Colletotrichum asianum]|uniref:Uncharacterized protein n=1 Tax=Colletotrichum asianum TaxID=702518 RepID=A0A8H3ZRL7_9PEZI|nr:hypothetical protein GQ607_009082 [Colletotrichum asianum]
MAAASAGATHPSILKRVQPSSLPRRHPLIKADQHCFFALLSSPGFVVRLLSPLQRANHIWRLGEVRLKLALHSRFTLDVSGVSTTFELKPSRSRQGSGHGTMGHRNKVVVHDNWDGRD